MKLEFALGLLLFSSLASAIVLPLNDNYLAVAQDTFNWQAGNFTRGFYLDNASATAHEAVVNFSVGQNISGVNISVNRKVENVTFGDITNALTWRNESAQFCVNVTQNVVDSSQWAAIGLRANESDLFYNWTNSLGLNATQAQLFSLLLGNWSSQLAGFDLNSTAIASNAANIASNSSATHNGTFAKFDHTNLTITGNLSIDGGVSLAKNLSVDSGTLFVDSSKNYVGIGTSAPTQALEVRSGVNVSSLTTSPAITLSGSTVNGGAGFLQFVNSTGLRKGYIGWGNAVDYTPHVDLVLENGNKLFISDGTTSTMAVDTVSKQVGIGTSTPESSLTVRGSAGSAWSYAEVAGYQGLIGINRVPASGAIYNSSMYGWQWNYANTSVTLNSFLQSNGGIGELVNFNGTTLRTGFGVTPTAAKVQIKGTRAGDYALYAENAAGSGAQHGGAIIGGHDSTDYSLVVNKAANAANYFVVRGDGNVGIGTASPTHQLQLTTDDAAKTTTTTWATTSDEKAKKNFTDYQNVLIKLDCLGPMQQYQYNGKYGITAGTKGWGWTAQKLLACGWSEAVYNSTFYNAATNETETFMQANYDVVFKAAVEAARELDANQTKLATRIDHQQKQLDAANLLIGRLSSNQDALKAIVCADHPEAELCK